jgi:thiol-disulfide isomerase/thioredoxin
MKKLLLVLSLSLICYFGYSQTSATNNATPAFISNPTIPAFTLYQAPDSTVFTNQDLEKKKPTLIMIFSPDCGHCQHATTLLLQNISHFKGVQILMTTWLPYSEMVAFYKNYKIADYPQITMGWDKKDFFLPYYHVASYPGMVVYDKKGKYVKSFSGDVNMKDLWEALGEN